MEKERSRVLAHELAQVVPDDLLQHVSGGNAKFSWKELTFQFSGPSMDLDAVFDWHF